MSAGGSRVVFRYTMECRILVSWDQHISSPPLFIPLHNCHGINQALKHLLHRSTGNTSTCQVPVPSSVVHHYCLDIHPSLSFGVTRYDISQRQLAPLPTRTSTMDNDDLPARIGTLQEAVSQLALHMASLGHFLKEHPLLEKRYKRSFPLAQSETEMHRAWTDANQG